MRFDPIRCAATVASSLVLAAAPAGASYTIESWGGQQAGEQFGGAAATAGDINGDGFSDIVVAAPHYDTSAGRVYVFYGSGAGVFDGVPTVIDSPSAGSYFFGLSVSSGADVNGDGFHDVLVGAPTESPGGSVRLFLGGPGGVDTSASWLVYGENSGDEFGRSVAFAGDVDGDGFGDILVGAPRFDGVEATLGKAYLFRGTSTGAETSAMWSVLGSGEGARFGSVVTSAGDVNIDGHLDVAVSAPDASPGGISSAGAVYVFHGSANGVETSPSSTLTGSGLGDRFGGALAHAGDVDGDGYGDLIIGAPFETEAWSSQGAVRIFRGSETGIVPTPWFTYFGPSGKFTGISVSGVGDVDGDGRADFAFSSRGDDFEGRFSVWAGMSDPAQPRVLFASTGSEPGEMLGDVLAAAGDVNGDGYSDFLHATGSFDGVSDDTGAVWVVHGRMPASISADAWTVAGATTNAHRGWSLALGDWNSDGYADAAIGESGPFPTTLKVHNGGPNGLSATPDRALTIAVNEGQFARSVDSAGDVNGDGYADLVHGGRGFSGEYGRAFLAWGSDIGPGGATLIGQGTSRYYGDAVAGAGDVNGDGHADVIVGAWDEGSGGVVRVFHGSASGLSATADWTMAGPQAGCRFGYSVDTAGDWNGDGYARVVIGLPHFDSSYINAGRADIYLGGPSGLASSPAWTKRGLSDFSYYGSVVAEGGDRTGTGLATVLVGAPGVGSTYVSSPTASVAVPLAGCCEDPESVANAGDIDGDGYADAVVGSKSANGNSGSIGIIKGGPNLTGSTLSYTAAVSGEQLGLAVAGNGDVNGDGFSDFLAGAPYYDGGSDDYGRARLFHGTPVTGVPRPAAQLERDRSKPVALAGAAASNSITTVITPGFPGGIGRYRLEIEMKPYDVPYDGIDTRSSGTADPAAVTQLFTDFAGLAAGSLHKWRWRAVSDHPVFLHTRWLSMSGNGANLPDFRAGPVLVTVGDSTPGHTPGLRVGRPAPNPFRSAAWIPFALDGAGPVTVSIFDVSGRRIATPLHEDRAAGDHEVAWNGLDRRGRTAPAGVYFYSVEHGGQSSGGRLVRTE